MKNADTGRRFSSIPVVAREVCELHCPVNSEKSSAAKQLRPRRRRTGTKTGTKRGTYATGKALQDGQEEGESANKRVLNLQRSRRAAQHLDGG
jgi:hypothetical protein